MKDEPPLTGTLAVSPSALRPPPSAFPSRANTDTNTSSSDGAMATDVNGANSGGRQAGRHLRAAVFRIVA